MNPPRAAREQGTQPPALLLLGPEEGEKSAFVEKVRTALASRLGEPPETHRFYAGETPMADVVLCLRLAD